MNMQIFKEKEISIDSFNNIMIDPSLIIARRTLMNTFENIVEMSKNYKFYIPESFRYILYSESNNLHKNSLHYYFLQNAYPADLNKVKTFIDKYSDNVSAYKVSADHKRKYKEFYNFIYDFIGDETICMVLFEEWVFLQENSWIVSRIKKPFNTFINAGSACLQFSKETVEYMIRRTLRDSERDLLNKVDVLRALGKWIAVGKLEIPLFIEPFETLLNLAAGYFLLFDP
jgi:hypothetical protein